MTTTPVSISRPGPEYEAHVRQGFSQPRLERLGASLEEQIAKGIFPGAVTMIMRHDECVHFEAYGFQDAAGKIPMARDSIFRLASMTKPLVTVAAMMLVERGRFNLYDPITNWLPELKDLKVEAPEGTSLGSSNHDSGFDATHCRFRAWRSREVTAHQKTLRRAAYRGQGA